MVYTAEDGRAKLFFRVFIVGFVALAIVVGKNQAETIKCILVEQGIIDDKRKIKRYEDKVEIPVKTIPDIAAEFEVVEQKNYLQRKPFIPFEEIKKLLKDIPERDLKHLPRKWEKFGDVLVVKMPGISEKERVARAYAQVLDCKTVLEDVRGISGITRTPHFTFIYGDNAETVHIENGIKYRFDVSRIMFSSGNVDERIRMASVAQRHEVVVDMFAGIGYFTLPLAVHGGAKVFACEINPVAYTYLSHNCMLNQVTDRVVPLLGDCRKVAPQGVASRIVMGYFDSLSFLSHALGVLKNEGVIHLHQKCREEDFPERILKKAADIAREQGKKVELLFNKKIKSYAPRIIHGVLDIMIS